VSDYLPWYAIYLSPLICDWLSTHVPWYAILLVYLGYNWANLELWISSIRAYKNGIWGEIINHILGEITNDISGDLTKVMSKCKGSMSIQKV
jgi:hypothetical protein